MKTVIVHFDVADHFVLLETFVASARAAKRTVDALNKEYFDGVLVFEVVVFPPEKGSLKQYIGFSLKGAVKALGWSFGGLAGLLLILDSNTVQDLSEEFLDGKPSELIIELVRDFQKRVQERQTNGFEASNEKELEELRKEEEQLVEEIVTRAAITAIEMPTAEIRKLDGSAELKFEISDSQADFFDQALQDSNVRAIGFTEGDDFPILRSSFAERAVRPKKIEVEPVDESHWVVEQKRVLVTSPNFDRGDQESRKWKGKEVGGPSVLFSMLDEEFWLKLRTKQVRFNETTTIDVQLGTKIENGKVKKRVCLRVLTVDGEIIAQPLTKDALNAVLGEFEEKEDYPEGWGLF